MKRHTKVYMSAMGYDRSDFIPCEVCEAEAVDIHHIERRGMGGSGKKDVIQNLMAVCRPCHVEYGDKKQYLTFLVDMHKLRMRQAGIK